MYLFLYKHRIRICYRSIRITYPCIYSASGYLQAGHVQHKLDVLTRHGAERFGTFEESIFISFLKVLTISYCEKYYGIAS